MKNFLKKWTTGIGDVWKSVRRAYRLGVVNRGKFRTWLVIGTSPFYAVWILIGTVLHAVGAFILGDFHE